MSNKKNIEIYGRLRYPVEIGKPAVIQEQHRIRRTSVVEHIIEYPSGVIYFETQNTRYTLRPIGSATV